MPPFSNSAYDEAVRLLAQAEVVMEEGDREAAHLYTSMAAVMAQLCMARVRPGPPGRTPPGQPSQMDAVREQVRRDRGAPQ